MKNQLKSGVIISYINIALNMFINIFFAPFLISSLGDAEYGVYRVVMSFAGQLSIMTLGMATLVSRNIVYFDTKKQQKEKENFLAMALIISVILSLAAFIFGMVMYLGADNIFKNSLSGAEIETAKRLIFIFIINISLTILNDFFAGMLTGHERFIEANTIKLVKLILRVVTLILLLSLGFKSVAIVTVDLMLTVIVLLFNIVYGMGKLKERVKYHYFDKEMFKTSILFSSAILLQAIINQVNQNLDGFILGVMVEPEIVAVYSVALTIFTTYGNIPTAMTSVFAPTVTRMVALEKSNEELTSFVSRIGRYQLMIAGLIVAGFILFGEEFLCVWINERYLPAYKVTLLLIIPTTIPLIQNGCDVILNAKLKRLAKSIILSLVAVLNLVISVLLIKRIGYIGAAYGTAISMIVGNVIIMNIYLQKQIGLNIIRMFRDIFHKLLPSIVLATVISIPLRWVNITDIPFVALLAKILMFVLVYVVIVYPLGLNKDERELFKNIIAKVLKIKKKEGKCNV